MIVASENNVVCSDEEVRDYLPAHHAGSKGDRDEDVLCLVRLHKEESIDSTDRVDLTGWREISRELYRAGEQTEYNYFIIRFSRRTIFLQMSVVLPICNQLKRPEKVLWGYEAQDTKNFELIVADDGSWKETYDMLQRITLQLPFQVEHVRHEDKGFRKCDTLNKGILAAQADCLLFSDGDCIPRKDFVSTHLYLRRKGRFLFGGYHKLSMNSSKDITEDDILSGRCFDLQWMRGEGMSVSLKDNKLTAIGFKRQASSTLIPTKVNQNGHNASDWLSDTLVVNGFDERMQYSGQNREFGERLENYGIHGTQIRYPTVCLHLDHTRGYKTKDSIQKNRNIRKHTRGAKIQRASLGTVKDVLRGQSARVNSYYDRYTWEEEKLASYKEKGGLYRHIYSLPCRWRRARYHNKVVHAYQQGTDAPVLSNHSGVIVPLTTFPPRISQLHLMLESILWQTCLSEKIIVWLSELEFPGRLNNLPEGLKTLVVKGIEFRFVSENFRSHKKYHYVFREYPDGKVITMDDDSIYPRNTVECLPTLSYQYPDTVYGNAIRKIHMDGNSSSVYRKWAKVFTMPVNNSLQNVVIGCGGIYYPLHWYEEELFDWKIISEHCLSVDDLRLRANELKRRVKVTGGGEFYPQSIELPQTQNNSLQKKNNGKTNLNDRRWKSLNESWRLDELYCMNGK